MIDTHAHLDALDDAGAALARAREAGVSRVIAIGTGVDSCRRVLELAEAEAGVYAALGVHPHDAGSAGYKDVAALAELLEHPRAVAVGETGLDHFRDYAPRDRQAALFRQQAALAVETGKALVVHTRAAEDETAAVLRELPAGTRVVLHCFSSSALLEPALERGWYCSFAGNVTYPKAAEVRWAAARVPRERILAETDSPYLSPQPVRGRANEPAQVVHTLRALAEARDEDPAELEAQIEANAARAFRLPEPSDSLSPSP
ncbi:MAG TPA: TatD family hydrolase [Gaiellaceae bacterium]|nr:TatD family hydrolase [Gaiellaceae bacterium]